MPAKVRPEYFPVLYVEPLAGNEAAVGFDLGSEPVRRAALEAALRTGHPAATEPVHLVQERHESTGVLVFVPVFRQGSATATGAPFRPALRGMVLAVFRTEDLMETALAAVAEEGLQGQIWDPATQRPDCLYAWGQATAKEAATLPTWFMGTTPGIEVSIPIADRTWRVDLKPTRLFRRQHLHTPALWVIPTGLLLTGLLATLIRVLQVAHRRAESLVEQRTGELQASLAKLAVRKANLRQVLDSTAEAIYGIDLHGDCTFCNKALLLATGYGSQEEVLGQNMHRLLHHSKVDGSPNPETDCRIFRAFRIREEAHVDDEVFWKRDGSSFPVEYWSYPQWVNGEVLGAVVTFIDISERRKAQQQALESEERRKAGERLAAITRGFLQMGPDTQRNLEIFVGLLRQLLSADKAHYLTGGQGHWQTKVSSPSPNGNAITAFSDLDLFGIAGGRSGVVELPGVESGMPARSVLFCPVVVQGLEIGVMAACRSQAVPWSPEDRTALEILAAATGIEEARADAEQESRSALANLHQAHKLESVGRLAAGVAHEINTPIQFLTVNLRFLQKTYGQLLDALQEKPADPEDLAWIVEEIPKVLEESLEGINRVAKIVRAMKEFSHPGSPERCKVDVNRCLESAATVSRNEWKYVAELELELDPELPALSGFPGELNQVFLNLIVNAGQAIAARLPRPEGLGKIKVSSSLAGDWLEIRIQDSGIGIPEAFQHRVFDPFFTTKDVGAGTGQGLSVSYQTVVVAHHGEISFRSEPGVGTTFLVRLPVSGNPPKGGAAC